MQNKTISYTRNSKENYTDKREITQMEPQIYKRKWRQLKG